MITSITMQSRWNKSYQSVKNVRNYDERDLDDLQKEIKNEIERMQILEKIVKSLNEDLSTKLIAEKINSLTDTQPIVTVKTKKKRTYYIGGLTIHEEDVDVPERELTEHEFDCYVKLWGCETAKADLPKEYAKYMMKEPARSLQDLIVDLWHISKTALAGGEFVPTRYDRMSYIKKTLLEKYPERCPKSMKQLWLDIEEFTSPVKY